MTQEGEDNRGIAPLADALSGVFANRRIQPLAEQISLSTAENDFTAAEIAAQDVLRSITAAKVMRQALLNAEKDASGTLGFNPFAELGDLIGRGGDVTQTMTERPALGGFNSNRMLEARIVPAAAPNAEQAVPVNSFLETPPAAPAAERSVPVENRAPNTTPITESQPAAPAPEEVSASAIAETPVAAFPDSEITPALNTSLEEAPSVLSEASSEPETSPVVVEAVTAAVSDSAGVEDETVVIPAAEEEEARDILDAIFQSKDPTHAELRRAVLAAEFFPNKMKELRKLILHLKSSDIPAAASAGLGLSERQQRLAFAALDVKESGERSNPTKESQVRDSYPRDTRTALSTQISNSVGSANGLVRKVEFGISAQDPETVDYTVLRVVDLLRLNPTTAAMNEDDRALLFKGEMSETKYLKYLSPARTPRTAEKDTEGEKKNDIVVPEFDRNDALRWVLHYVNLTDERREELREMGISAPAQTIRRLRQFVEQNRKFLGRPETMTLFTNTHETWRAKLDHATYAGDATIHAHLNDREVYNALILLRGVDTPEKMDEFLKRVYKN